MKKLISIFLVVLLIITMTSTGCSATSDAWKNNIGTVNLDSMTVTGEGISVSENIISITKGGDFEVTGTLADGMIYVNSDTSVKIRLSGANITNTSGPAIFFENAEKAFVTISKGTENFITDGKTYNTEDANAAIFSNDDLEIKGEGSLTVVANYKHGIASDDDLKIEEGTINITSYEHGIKVNDDLKILDGKITIEAQTGKGMKAGVSVTIDGGALDITSKENEGIESKGLLTINGGNIKIDAADDGLNTGTESTTSSEAETQNSEMPQPPELTEGEVPQMPEGGFKGKKPDSTTGMRGERPQMPQNGEIPQPPEGGEVPQKPEDFENGKNFEMPQGGPGEMGGGFGRVDEETAAAHAILITGGDVYIKTNCDGIDSNGNLTISGGKVIIDGPKGNGDGPLDSQGTMTISGGTVFTASSAGMIQMPQTENSINNLRIYFDETQTSGTVILIKDKNGGKELISHTPTQDFQVIALASEKLKIGKTYELYTNNELYKEITLKNASTTVGNFVGGGFGGRGGMNRQPISSINGTRNDEIKVFLNGNKLDFNTKPILKNNTTLVGFRSILEALGAEVSWEDSTQTAIATKDDTVIKLSIGSTKASVNGEEYTLLTAPELINDNTMIPVRFVSERLGLSVDWNERTQSVIING